MMSIMYKFCICQVGHLHKFLFFKIEQLSSLLVEISESTKKNGFNIFTDYLGLTFSEKIFFGIILIVSILLILGLILLVYAIFLKYKSLKKMNIISNIFVSKPVMTLVDYLTTKSIFSKEWIKDNNPVLFVTGYDFDFLLGKPYNENEYDCMWHFNKLFQANDKFEIHYYLKNEPSEIHYKILFGNNGIKKEYKDRFKLRIIKSVDEISLKNMEIRDSDIELYDDFYNKLDKKHFIVSFSLENNVKKFYSLMVEHEHIPREQSVRHFDFFDNFYKSDKSVVFKKIVNLIENNSFIYKNLKLELDNIPELITS